MEQITEKLKEFENKIICGDCLEVLKEIPDESIDAVITDPPYGLGFMGNEWDTFDRKQFGIKGMEGQNDLKVKKNFNILPRFSTDGLYEFSYKWTTECLRVLKPGGHLFSFGGTRTYHKMACAVEDAGFEIRDMIEWVYGSGFPKSLNIGKAVDKLQGNERELVRTAKTSFLARTKADGSKIGGDMLMAEEKGEAEITYTKGTSEWEGWGTALKPAHEPICMARKPLAEKTVAENCLKWGTGGINIDESRVDVDRENEPRLYDEEGASGMNCGDSGFGNNLRKSTDFMTQGRFPANLIVDGCEEVENLFPETKQSKKMIINNKGSFFGGGNNKVEVRGHNDTGGSASRFFYHAEFTEEDYPPFFYCAKASRNEKNAGLEDIPEKIDCDRNPKINNHPTVKPIKLIEYLIKLVSREGAIILDPFVGSGTTAIACLKTNRNFIGFEISKEYCDIANKRLEYWVNKLK